MKEAYRLLPWAEVLYSCDAAHWIRNDGFPDFAGERWSSHSAKKDDKSNIAEKYNLHLVEGRHGKGFSLDPNHINYGGNSGFQAVNLAILFGARKIVLVGFDMRAVEGKRYFFGNDPRGRGPGYNTFKSRFDVAAKMLPSDISIVNATPNSALTSFPMVSLDAALASQT